MVNFRCFTSWLLCFMCASVAGIADAHTLHVGNYSFALSQTKYTTPSLAFKVPNEATWYAPLTTAIISNTLHVKTPRQEYCVDAPDDYAAHIAETCPEIFTDTENYTYDENGRLIGADENLYLTFDNGQPTNYTWENTPTPYINTGVRANQDTRVLLLFKQNQWANIFGARTSNTVANFSFMCPKPTDQRLFRTDYGSTQIFSNISCPQSDKVVVDKNKNVTTIYLEDGTINTTTGQYTNFTTSKPLLIFAVSRGDYSTPLLASNGTNIYYFKIYDNGTLVRHFVPVPACMRIGDFIVPENGMWDIVNQQFYGNSGTGSFIYGKDE